MSVSIFLSWFGQKVAVLEHHCLAVLLAVAVAPENTKVDIQHLDDHCGTVSWLTDININREPITFVKQGGM